MRLQSLDYGIGLAKPKTRDFRQSPDRDADQDPAVRVQGAGPGQRGPISDRKSHDLLTKDKWGRPQNR
jgi:hypothetical protein